MLPADVCFNLLSLYVSNCGQVYVLGKTKQKNQHWKLQVLVASDLKEASLSRVPET